MGINQTQIHKLYPYGYNQNIYVSCFFMCLRGRFYGLLQFNNKINNLYLQKLEIRCIFAKQLIQK